MMGSELDAAGIREPDLRETYQYCRTLNARHGETFFLATRLLAPPQCPPVHALYGFARSADDILDDLDSFLDSALAAVAHTAHTYDIGWDLFDDFLTSMRMDLTVTDYPDRAASERRMYGSAGVIGMQLLPVLGSVGPREDVAPYAAALGKAFQLANFLRDVDEDLRRGRVYLPADELAAHGVDRDVLIRCQQHQRTDTRVRAALSEQHAITRAVYAQARPGINTRAPRSRACVSAALTLYSDIVIQIEAIDFEIFGRRARVAAAAVGFGKAWAARFRLDQVTRCVPSVPDFHCRRPTPAPSRSTTSSGLSTTCMCTARRDLQAPVGEYHCRIRKHRK